MKRYLSNTIAALAAVVLMAGFTACGSDDDEGGVPSKPTAIYGNRLLKSIGEYSFNYDENGRCTKILCYGEEFITIDYSRSTITLEEETYNATFNSNGHLSRLSANINESQDGYKYKLTGNSTFNYDNAGHLTGGTSTYAAEYSEDGEYYTESGATKIKYTWSNGNVTNVYLTEEYTEDGEQENGTTSIDITYGDNENPYKQWTYATEDFMMAADAIGFIGLLGNGPELLAKSYTETENYDGGSNTTRTKSVSYTLNDDGTIGTERIGNGRYNYTYTPYNDKNEVRVQPTSGRQSTIKIGSLLRIHQKVKELKARPINK